MRVSEGQWGRFLGVLGRLSFAVEIIAIAYEDLFHNVALPANVTIEKRPYCKTEADVISALTDAGVDACYLGLWKDTKQELFSRTSLSAKLTTYVAAGVPVIVDGPETSVAWRLIREFNGGVLVEDDAGKGAMTLERLFTDLEWWSKLSDGARKLCLDQFDLEKNAARLSTLLVEDANGR
jgi:glycosyltransferase involved in cell wall biosynthesis